MKKLLALISGLLQGIGVGMIAIFWIGHGYGLVKAEFMTGLAVMIIAANFLILGWIVLWLSLRREHHIVTGDSKF